MYANSTWKSQHDSHAGYYIFYIMYAFKVVLDIFFWIAINLASNSCTWTKKKYLSWWNNLYVLYIYIHAWHTEILKFYVNIHAKGLWRPVLDRRAKKQKQKTYKNITISSLRKEALICIFFSFVITFVNKQTEQSSVTKQKETQEQLSKFFRIKLSTDNENLSLLSL